MVSDEEKALLILRGVSVREANTINDLWLWDGGNFMGAASTEEKAWDAAASVVKTSE